MVQFTIEDLPVPDGGAGEPAPAAEGGARAEPEPVAGPGEDATPATGAAAPAEPAACPGEPAGRPPLDVSIMRPGGAPRVRPAGIGIGGAVGLSLLWLWVANMSGGIEYFLDQAHWLPIQPATMLALSDVLGTSVTLWIGLRLCGLGPATVLPIRRFPSRIVPGILLGATGATVLLARVLPSLVQPSPWAVSAVEALARSSGALLLLVLVVIGPVLEELLFRGLLLRALMPRLGTARAVAVSTALFALVHLNPPQSISALLLGVGAAFLVLRTGSLLPGMLLHAAWNTSALFMGAVITHGVGPGGAEPHVPDMLVAAGAFALTLGALTVWWQLRSTTDGRAPGGPQSLLAALPRPVAGAVTAALLGPLALVLAAAALTGGARARAGDARASGPDPAAVAGCYRLAADGVPLALFGDSARAPTTVRLTAVRLPASRYQPTRYSVEAVSATPARARADTTYWSPAPANSVRVVDMRRDLGGTVLLLELRKDSLLGTAKSYARGGSVVGAPRHVRGWRVACPRDPPPPASPAARASAPAPGARGWADDGTPAAPVKPRTVPGRA